MYFSHFDAETNARLVEDAGFGPRSARVETAYEDGRPVAFFWVVAEKPGEPRVGSSESANEPPG